MNRVIKIQDRDNVVVAVDAAAAGSEIIVDDRKIRVREDIPAGHKIAVRDIPAGQEVLKYGTCIGHAVSDISQGAWVHTHNLKTALGDLLTYSYHPESAAESKYSETMLKAGNKKQNEDRRTCFQGFRRNNGKVGVRNEVWIIPTVGCVNNVATTIAGKANQILHSMGATTVEEVVAFPHPYGCSQMGDDQEHTRQILADLVNHPNAGGVLVLGLGCENSNIEELKKYIGAYDANRVRFLVAQECEDELEEGTRLCSELIEYASEFQREEIPAGELIIGLKCGGSDGFSGITANPLVGAFSDILIDQGGTTILTEVPEMFGAETILMNRCADEKLFGQTVELINDFKNYFTEHHQTIYENPSPGNKKGGISTLEDKSLGCTQKSGTSQVKGVLKYGEAVETKGLNLLSAPGNDLVASTALAASGAHIVLFTTGRGTPFASPVPTVKIASNVPLAEKKKNWIDFSAGGIVEGQAIPELAGELYDFVLEVASGKKVRAEEAGFHDMAIFKQGVTL